MLRYTPLGRQFTSFAGVGAIGTGTHYLVLAALVRFADADPILASTAGFAIGAFVNYYLNYRFTFRSDKAHGETMVKFFTVALLGCAVNALVIAVAVGWFSIHYLLGQVLATGCVLVCTFCGNRLWTFQ